MKYIVWGGNGFIGKNIVEKLAVTHTVYSIVREKGNGFLEEKNNRNAIILTEEEIDNIIHEADYMIFVAWRGTSGNERGNLDIQLENIQLTCRAIQVAKKKRCKKFVYAGSIMEYEALNFMREEGNAPSTNYLYNVSKLAADYYAKILCNTYGIQYCNALISNIYGPGEMSQRFLISVCRKMIQGLDIELTSGVQLYDFIYIEDAVRAIILVAERGNNNTEYYIGNSTQRELREFVWDIKEVLESESELLFGKIEASPAVLSYLEFDVKKLEQEFGFKCQITFKDGVRRTAEWIRGDIEYGTVEG